MTGFGRFPWLRRSAAQWFVRLRAAPITPRLDAKFRRWLASDPANEVDYERHELAWELAGELAQDEEIERLLADAQPQSTPARTRTPSYFIGWSAAAVALVLTLGIGSYALWPSRGFVYSTEIGEQRTVVLPDQSRLFMNSDTRAHVAFNRSARVVTLERGEATFSVTRDERRPFEVHAGNGTTRVLGTAFNVLAGDHVTVSVLTGTVEVAGPSTIDAGAGPRTAVLIRGQEITYDAAGLSQIEPADTARINAWHAGRVAFDDLALPQALQEFNRYSRTPIVLADPSLAQVRVSGVFRIGETDALLQALYTAFDIDAEQRGEVIELRGRR